MTNDLLSIVADIGGTNTRVALAEGKRLLPDLISRFRNAEYPDLETILRHYLDEAGHHAVAGACVAVAGPVRDGVAEMTNLDWTIVGENLAQATGATTRCDPERPAGAGPCPGAHRTGEPGGPDRGAGSGPGCREDRDRRRHRVQRGAGA